MTAMRTFPFSLFLWPLKGQTRRDFCTSDLESLDTMSRTSEIEEELLISRNDWVSAEQVHDIGISSLGSDSGSITSE